MNHPDEAARVASPTLEAKPRRWLRRWLAVLAILLVLAALAVAFLGPPVIASLARSGIRSAAHDRGYEATLEDVTFTWSDGLQIDGLAAEERRPHGIRLAVARIEIGPRWRDLVRGRLGFGRFRVVRPHLILDTRRRPDPPKKPGPEGSGGGDRPGDEADATRRLDLPMVVVDGVVEVRGRPGVPGFRVEDLDVDGRMGGDEQRVSGAVTGCLLSGPLRETLQMEGDVTLRGADGMPHGSARFRAAGIDIGALAACFAREGRPGLERGRLQVEGEVKAEGRHLALTAKVTATDLEVTTGRPGDAPILEPSLTLTTRARHFPDSRRTELKVEVRGTEIGADADGWFRGPRARALDFTGSFAGRLRRAAPFLENLEQLAGEARGRFRIHGESGRYNVQAGARVTGFTVARAGKNGAEAMVVRSPEAAAQVQMQRFPEGQRETKLVFKSARMTVSRPAMRLENLRVAGRSDGARLHLESATAEVNGGAASVRGTWDLAGTSPRFALTAEAKGVEVTGTLAALLEKVVPLYHVPEGIRAQLGGQVTGQCELAGSAARGVPFDRHALAGTGQLQVDRGFVEGSALVAKLFTDLGGRTRYAFRSLETRFRLAEGFVHHEYVRTLDRNLTWGFKGKTGLDGTIDYQVDPGPIVARVYRRKERKGKMRGWEKVLKESLGSLEALPFGIRGTLDRPELALRAPPDPESVEKVAPKVIGGLLDDLLRRKKERDEKKRAKRRARKAKKQAEREKAAREKAGAKSPR